MFDIQRLEDYDKDLVDKIYSYITYPQPQFLLDDIKSFHKTKNKLTYIYNERYTHEPEEVDNWIYNDLILFYNEDNPIMNGYTYGYIDKINRCFIEYSNKDTIKYIEYCDNKKNTKSLINIYISRLTVDERFTLLNMISNYE